MNKQQAETYLFEVIMHEVASHRLKPNRLKLKRIAKKLVLKFNNENFRELYVPDLHEPNLRLLIRKEYFRLAFKSRIDATKAHEVGHYTVSAETDEQKKPDTKQPPFNAELLLHIFLSGEENEPLIGCLIERYGRKVERLGRRRADIWFYYEVGRTALPLVRRFAGKAIKFAVLGEWIRRMIQ